MLLAAQRVNHQHLHPLQLGHLLGCHVVGVGDVRHRPYAVAEHRQILVHGLHGHHLDPCRRERSLHRVQVRLGQSGVLVRLENIVVVTFYGKAGLSVEVHIHLAVLHIVERPYIIQSSNMVAMGVRDEDGIQAAHIFAQHLLPEIGADVEQDVPALHLEQRRGTKTPIA